MTNPIQRSSYTDQVANQLSESIRNRQFKPGDQLPSVEKLSADLGVGRSTVREALRLLQARGLVEIIHGVGTFVAPERIARQLGVVVSFSSTILERGMKPRSLVLQQEVIPADEETASRMQLNPGDKINVLKRLRLADDIPLALETSISIYERFPEVINQDWNGEASLYKFLYERYQARPHASDQSVQAIACGKAQSQHLLIPPKSPVLLVETTAYDETGAPFEYGRSYYRADRYEYRVHLKHD
jgi:GntR family transcriptional regulator